VAVLFDTTTLDARQRSESWSDAHQRIFFPIGVRFSSKVACMGRIEGHRLGAIGAYRVTSDPSEVHRSRTAIGAFDPEEFLVAMSLRGRCVIEQADRASAFGTGDISSWDSSHPFSVRHLEPFDLLLIVVPQTLLGPRQATIVRRTAGLVTHNSNIGSIAAPFFRGVWDGIESDGSSARWDDLADGVLAIVRALHFAAEVDPPRNIPASALLPSIKAYIDQHLGDGNLAPEAIARAHYISTRYLHKLFEGDGISVSEWVRHRRLEACRRDLRDPALAHETISDVARRWALPNPAHFSRIFRDSYGCTPTELRQSAEDERRAREHGQPTG
jgi:AraC-like DNA-binding protein